MSSKEAPPTSNDFWAGWNNEQVKGDDLAAVLKKRALPVNYAGGIRNNQISQGEMEKLIMLAKSNQVPVLQTTVNTPTTATNFDLQNFLAENKLLILGVLAVGAFMMFSGGGGLAESTTVKRYATRK